MSEPLVTVLMSVYNAESYLNEAIDSILNQTYTTLEFLIINDASTDNSLKIIETYKDQRIRLINNKSNLKLTTSLNKGIDLAKGQYIARMDADDVSLPERLERQVTFMTMHPKVGLCGSFVRTLGLKNDYDVSFQTNHDEIKFRLFFNTHFPHPAAMLRKSILDKHNLKFDISNPCAQDYELWNKIASHCELAIIPEVLVLKRTHENQISVKQADEQYSVVKKIHKDLIKQLSVNASQAEIELYESFLSGVIPSSKDSLFMLFDFFDKLIAGNNQTGIYNKAIFNRYFAEKCWMFCTTSTNYGIDIYKKYMRSLCYQYFRPPILSRKKFLLKSLLRYNYDKANT